jgi:hypothetical protein
MQFRSITAWCCRAAQSRYGARSKSAASRSSRRPSMHSSAAEARPAVSRCVSTIGRRGKCDDITTDPHSLRMTRMTHSARPRWWLGSPIGALGRNVRHAGTAWDNFNDEHLLVLARDAERGVADVEGVAPSNSLPGGIPCGNKSYWHSFMPTPAVNSLRLDDGGS